MIDHTTPIHCTACKQEVLSTYCGNCGQKAGRKPLSLWNIITDFFSNYFSFERSGLATIVLLLRNPRFVVHNYYMGNKGYFASPGKLLIFTILVFAFHTTFVNKRILGLHFEFGSVNTEYGYWLLFIPLFTLISQITFFRQGANLSRHFISSSYIATSFLAVLLILNDLTLLCFGDILSAYPFIFYILCVFFWNSWALSKKRKPAMYVFNAFIELCIFIALFALALTFGSTTDQ